MPVGGHLAVARGWGQDEGTRKPRRQQRFLAARTRIGTKIGAESLLAAALVEAWHPAHSAQEGKAQRCKAVDSDSRVRFGGP